MRLNRILAIQRKETPLTSEQQIEAAELRRILIGS